MHWLSFIFPLETFAESDVKTSHSGFVCLFLKKKRKGDFPGPSSILLVIGVVQTALGSHWEWGELAGRDHFLIKWFKSAPTNEPGL